MPFKRKGSLQSMERNRFGSDTGQSTQPTSTATAYGKVPDACCQGFSVVDESAQT